MAFRSNSAMVQLETRPTSSGKGFCLSASPEEKALPMIRSISFTHPTNIAYPSTSSSCSESSSDLLMAKDLFTLSTRQKIHAVCCNRCVVCMRKLGDVGQCSHILDASKKGANMVTYATKVGVLQEGYSRSAASNGVVFCSSCHQDLFTPKLVVFSLHERVLKYLINHVRSGNPMPIHEVLDKLLLPSASRSGLHDPATILPFLGLYTLAALAPERLRSVEFHMYHEAEVSELINNHWAAVSPKTTPVPPITARIHDATALYSSGGPGCDLQLSDMSPHDVRYWRLPTKIAPILSYLLYRVAHLLDSESEEIRLAIELRCLLTWRHIESKRVLSGPGNQVGDLGGGSNAPSRSPGDEGGGGGGGEFKRGHEEDVFKSSKRARNEQDDSNEKRGGGNGGGEQDHGSDEGGEHEGGDEGACGKEATRPIVVQHRRHKSRRISQAAQGVHPSDGWRFDGHMTTDQIIFAARGIVLF